MENTLLDFRYKKLKKIEEMEIAELKKKEDNKNSYLDDGDWSSYKKNKKNKIFGDFNKKKIKKILNTFIINNNTKLLKKLWINNFNLLEYKKIFNNFINFKQKISINKNNFLLNYYNSINLKRLKEINKETIFSSFEKKVILIIDIRKIKSKIIVMYKNKSVLTLTPGILFNKLKMKEKSLKKTQKLFSLMVKLVISSVKTKIKIRNYIINIKGTKSKLSNLILLVKKNFNIKNDKLIFLYTPFLKTNFKFKKIKSIKRRLKKKIIRFK